MQERSAQCERWLIDRKVGLSACGCASKLPASLDHVCACTFGAFPAARRWSSTLTDPTKQHLQVSKRKKEKKRKHDTPLTKSTTYQGISTQCNVQPTHCRCPASDANIEAQCYNLAYLQCLCPLCLRSTAAIEIRVERQACSSRPRLSA
jgi:hypothetical protein